MFFTHIQPDALREAMNRSTTYSNDIPRPEFGVPEVEFRPTFGQTAAGLLIHGSCAAGIFACAFFDPRFDAAERFVVGSCGITSLAFAYWVYALRKWRLWVCPGGVVQRRAWGVDEIAWSQVREAVVERHYFTRNPDNVMLVRDGVGGNVKIQPTNCAHWKQAVAAVLQAVNDRQITVRTVRA
jgi:hypothetical protein